MSHAPDGAEGSRPPRTELFLRPDGCASIVSHRSTNQAGYPPNTVEAALQVIEEGADWVEMDVQLSADGDMVLHHNVMHEGDEIRRLPTREIRRRGMVTLAEMADAVPPGIGLFLDVKHSLPDAPGEDPYDLFSAVTGWADDVSHSRAVAVVSFCPSLLKPDRSLVSVGISAHLTTPLYQVLASSALFGASVAMVHADDILNFGDEFTDVDACVEAVGRFGVAVVAWSAQPDDVPALLSRGVTGVCGEDIPALVSAARQVGPVRQAA